MMLFATFSKWKAMLFDNILLHTYFISDHFAFTKTTTTTTTNTSLNSMCGCFVEMIERKIFVLIHYNANENDGNCCENLILFFFCSKSCAIFSSKEKLWVPCNRLLFHVAWMLDQRHFNKSKQTYKHCIERFTASCKELNFTI